VPPKQFDPGDDDRGAPDHRVERLEGLLLAEPREPLDQELKIGLYGTVIDVLGITSRRHYGVVIVSVPNTLAATEYLRNSVGVSQLRRKAWRL